MNAINQQVNQSKKDKNFSLCTKNNCVNPNFKTFRIASNKIKNDWNLRPRNGGGTKGSNAFLNDSIIKIRMCVSGGGGVCEYTSLLAMYLFNYNYLSKTSTFRGVHACIPAEKVTFRRGIIEVLNKQRRS